MLVKNSFGCSIVPSEKFRNDDFLGEFKGSSLDRKKEEKGKPESLEEEQTAIEEKEEKKERWRSLSSRTKTKIKKKILAFFGQYKKLTFLTLTFVNEISDRLAVEILAKFLENTKKQDKDFEFLWVAERQTNNNTFKANIHFHLITNKYWKIEKCWKYWLTLQAKHGIIPRDESFQPTSSFDVKAITSKNAKGIGTYLTKYVTKNASKYLCQVWNCSKRISQLYTDFYTDHSFLANIQRLEYEQELKIQRVKAEYSEVFYYPLNRITIRFYDRLHEHNKQLFTKNKNEKNEQQTKGI